MPIANKNERMPGSYAAFFADQTAEVRIAAANAEAISQVLHPLLVALVSGFQRWLAEPLVRWYGRRRVENQLMSMDDHMLADIGISRSQVQWVAWQAFRTPEETPQQAATVHHLPVEKKRQDAAAAADDPGHPLAA